LSCEHKLIFFVDYFCVEPNPKKIIHTSLSYIYILYRTEREENNDAKERERERKIKSRNSRSEVNDDENLHGKHVKK
jgi:hypothetical protein